MRFYVVQTHQGNEWVSRDIVRMQPCHLTKYLSFLAGQIKIGGLGRCKSKITFETRVKPYIGNVTDGYIEFDGEKFIRHDDCGEAEAA